MTVGTLEVAVNVRILLRGDPFPWRRARVVAWFAKLLGVPIDIEQVEERDDGEV